MKKNRFQFLSFIIEKSDAGWWILDWDYEGEQVVGGPYQSVHKAMDEAVRRCGG